MRIISGKFKGRRISAPSNITARPTTDFAKEGLFNLLNNRIDFEDIRVLDLFAGTGSISVEFVSRGAASVVSVEQNDRHCAFIRKVCNELKIQNLSLLKTDVFRFLKSSRASYDVVFADPPYDHPAFETLPDLVINTCMTSGKGLFILEHPSKMDFSTHPYFNDHRHYGNVNFTFFANPKTGNED
ncbi:MAG: 16S rRNA (guanine(966)-N(2))-methyltransferase RsmD [Paludibacteraceae bacterium]|nr:16S rRNA (guanine(966)-N(2))-methyltransferase RsmD [Paludibacteraceae bacterium]